MLKTSTLLLQLFIGLAATSCDWDTWVSDTVQPIAAATSTTNTSTTTTTTNNNASSTTTTAITITDTTDMTIIVTTTTTTTNIDNNSNCPQSGCRKDIPGIMNEQGECICEDLQKAEVFRYQHFPGFSCYKTFSSEDEISTWSEARATCKEDGGDLWVMETEQEKDEVFIPLYNSVKVKIDPFVGVFQRDDNDWMTVKNQHVPSTWWRRGEPEKIDEYLCAIVYRTGLMGDVHCANDRPFICEIPP